MKVRLKPTCSANGLTPGRVYLVLSIEYSRFRLIEDRGEPIIYPACIFDVIDASVSPDWCVSVQDVPTDIAGHANDLEDVETSFHLAPAELPRFLWARWHDGDPAAIAWLAAYLHRLGPTSWPAEA